MSGQERLAALRAGHGWDFRYEQHPKCPHCGHTLEAAIAALTRRAAIEGAPDGRAS